MLCIIQSSFTDALSPNGCYSRCMSMLPAANNSRNFTPRKVPIYFELTYLRCEIPTPCPCVDQASLAQTKWHRTKLQITYFSTGILVLAQSHRVKPLQVDVLKCNYTYIAKVTFHVNVILNIEFFNISTFESQYSTILSHGVEIHGCLERH